MIPRQVESLISAITDQFLRNPLFLNQLTRFFEGSAMFRMMVDRSIQKALETLALPSRRDMEQLSEQIQDLRAQAEANGTVLESIRHALDEIRSAPPGAGKAEKQTGPGASSRSAPPGAGKAGKQTGPGASSRSAPPGAGKAGGSARKGGKGPA